MPPVVIPTISRRRSSIDYEECENEVYESLPTTTAISSVVFSAPPLSPISSRPTSVKSSIRPSIAQRDVPVRSQAAKAAMPSRSVLSPPPPAAQLAMKEEAPQLSLKARSVSYSERCIEEDLLISYGDVLEESIESPREIAPSVADNEGTHFDLEIATSSN